MNSWILLQVFLNLFFGVALFVLSMRLLRAPKDDPRLSRGLQLLQSKISVLEDLSDKTEHQVNHLCTILDQKARDLQNKIHAAERHVQLIRSSMDKSLEVAQIFEDKIPHHEIIERKTTRKYVEAARLAHAGKSIDEISQLIDLPRGELEFITKINRDQLMFSEDQLPEWARPANLNSASDTSSAAMLDSSSMGSVTSSQQLNRNSLSWAEESALDSNFPSSLSNQTKPASHDDVKSGYDIGLEIAQEMGLVSEHQSMVRGLQRIQADMDDFDRRQPQMHAMDTAFESPQVDLQSLSRLGEEFRKAVSEFDYTSQPSKHIAESSDGMNSDKSSGEAAESLAAAMSGDDSAEMNQNMIRSQSDLAALLDEARYNLGLRRHLPKAPSATASTTMDSTSAILRASTTLLSPIPEVTKAAPDTIGEVVYSADAFLPSPENGMNSPSIQHQAKSALQAAKEVAQAILHERTATKLSEKTNVQPVRPSVGKAAPRIFSSKSVSVGPDPVVRKVEFPRLKM